jgi:GNAT superfamily N-acetyltransferase
MQKPQPLVTVRRAEPADQAWITQSHAELYQRDEGFDATFGPLVANVLSRFFASHDETCETGLIAEANGSRLGCVFVMREDAQTARLRLFLLLPEARGQGIGQRLHDALLQFASDAGYARIALSTHESHAAACRLYRRNGWKILSRNPVRSFGNDLIELAWAKNLQSERDDPLAPTVTEG